MKKNIFIATVLFTSTLITLNSCKKKTEVDNETQSVVDNALCEQQFMAIAPTVNDRGKDPADPGFKVLADCSYSWTAPSGTLALPNGSYTAGPQTFTIDYTGSCTAEDGTQRTGKMYITSSHKWSAVKAMPLSTQPTVTVTVTFDGYMVGAVSYGGTVTVIKNNNVIQTKVENGTCTSAGWPNGISYATDGFKTTEISPDGETTKIWGDSHGVNREGRSFTTTIPASNPIIKKRNCKWISSGQVSVTPDGFKTRTVDYGNGDCNDDATFTVDGQTVKFKLK